MYLQIKFIWAKIMYFHSLLILVYHSSCSHLNSPRAWMGFCPPKWCDTNQTAPRTSNILVYSRKQAKWKKDNNQWCTNPNPDFIWIRCKSNVGTSFFYTLYKKPPDLGLCLELCQHCACLFHTCRSHREYALLLDMTSFRSGGFLECVYRFIVNFDHFV